MGTNFYRIPSVKELEDRKNKLQTRVRKMDLSPSSINTNFNIGNGPDEWTYWSPWDEFTNNILVHLGKRSMGWKFCWNFNNKKYYTNKDELFDFIKKGRIIDEYGDEINQDEFIQMALDWCKDGWDIQTYYNENPSSKVSWFDSSRYHDIYIDGLRVSTSTEFS